MYSVELYSRVRRACHVGGMSERAAARTRGDRATGLERLPSFKELVSPRFRRRRRTQRAATTETVAV